MSSTHDYQIKELQRQVKGMQRQIGVVNARLDVTSKAHERRIRDLEIKTAVQSGVTQKKVAENFDISAGRVSQIVKKVA
jgi:predicted XRE-type DNA-binding protein